MILDWKLYFVTKLTKKLENILKIKTRLLVVFYLFINKQTKQIN